MKKSIFIIAALLLTATFSIAGEDIFSKDATRLPNEARKFIKEYFSDAEVSFVEIDRDFMHTTYEVTLSDRTGLEFDGSGKWREVSCVGRAVPEELVPEDARSYVKTRFPDEYITSIAREFNGVEIDLGRGLSLEFNSNGRLIDMDD